MKYVYVVSISNSMEIENEMHVFSRKVDAIKCVNDVIDMLKSNGYEENDLTTDRSELWMYDYGEYQVVIDLQKKAVK